MKKLRMAIGVILLIVLLAPVLILARPATRVEPVVYEHPYRLEFIEHRYIPLVEVVNMWIAGPLTHPERVSAIVYFGLYGLAFWLILSTGKKKTPLTKEVPSWQTNEATE
jgi:dolichol kinase